MAIIHAGQNSNQVKLDSNNQKRKISIAKAVCIAVCISIVSVLLGSDQLWNRFDDWAWSDAVISRGLRAETLVIAFLLMFSFPLQIALRFVIPVSMAVMLYREIQSITKKSQEEKILEAGLVSERKALQYLSALSDDFHIFTNLRVPYDGASSELDLVCLSPFGIKIIEVKGHKGELTADNWSVHNLRHFKGEREQPQVYNPLKQVGSHVYRLSGYLRSHGYGPWITGYVFFTSPDLVLDIEDENPNVFTYSSRDKLLSRLQTGKRLSEREQREIIKLLDRLI